MTKKVIAFGCWNNERNIAMPNQAGKLHTMLFTTEKAAREHYVVGDKRDSDDPIVRVVVETIDSKESDS